MKKTKRLINLSFLLAIVLALIGGSQAWGQSSTITFSAATGTSGNWSNSANWTGGSVPTETDYVDIPTGQTAYLNGDQSVYRLEVTGTLKPATSGTYALTVKEKIYTYGSDNTANIVGSNSDGRMNIIMDNSSSKAITCVGKDNIEFNDFTLPQGSAATIDKSFKLGGDLTLNDNTTLTQSSGTCTITGANSSIDVPDLGTLTLYSLKLASTASNVTTSSDFTIDEGYFHLENGAKFSASSGTITINDDAGGNVYVSPKVVSDAPADCEFANVYFNTSGNSGTFSPSTGYTVTGNFDKGGGGAYLATAGNLKFDNNGSKNSPKSLSGNSNISFFDLTVTDGSHITTASSATINGFSTGGNNLTVEGTGSFVQTSGTMTFLETTASANVGTSVSSNGIMQLNDVRIYNSSNNTFYSNTDLMLTGDFRNYSNSSASFTAPSTVVFVDTTGQTGDKKIENLNNSPDGLMFNDLTLRDNANNTKVVLASSSTVTIWGDLTIKGNSEFDANTNSATVTLGGNTPMTLTNEGTCKFYDVKVEDNSGKVLNTSSDFTVGNQIYLGSSASSGAFNASDGIVTFSITGDPFATTTKDAHQFYSLKFTGTADDDDNANNLKVKGDFIVASGATASFTGNDGIDGDVLFNGTGEQRFKNNGSCHLDDVELDNSNGLVMEGDLYMGASATFAESSATLTLTNGDIDLNGDYFIQFSHTGCALAESTGNTVLSSKAGSAGYIATPATSEQVGYSDINASGLGFGGLDAGTSIQVKRYHRPRTIDGLSSIERYFYVTGTDLTSTTSATFGYDESELNGNTEEYLTAYISQIADASEYTSSASSTTTKWWHTSGSVTASTNKVTLSSINRNTGYYMVAPKFLKIAYFPTENIHNDNLVDESPLAANSTNKTILGFSLTATSDVSSAEDKFTALNLDFNRTPSGIFSDFEIYKDNNSDLSDYAYGTAEATGSLSESTVQFSSLAQSFTAGQTEYYFIVADVNSTVNSSTPSIYAEFDQDDMTMNNIYKMNQTITGPTYSFGALDIALSSANSPSSGPLEKNANDQTIYGFSLDTPEGAESITFNSVNVKVTVGDGAEYDDFENFELYNDANKNGIKDNGEGALSSIANIDESTGILTFSGLGESLTAGETTEYIVIVDVKSDANANGTIKCKINSYSDVSLTSPATVPEGGPYEGNSLTVKSAPIPGSPTKLEFTAFSMDALNSDDDKAKGENEIIADENIVVQVKAVDANGYPQKVDQATTITLTPLGGTTLNANNTISLSVNNSTGKVENLQFTTESTSSEFSLKAATTAGMSLTADTLSDITVYYSEPTTFFDGVSVADIEASTATVNWTNAGSDDALVVVKAGSMPANPEDGIDYNASADFSSPASTNGTTGTGSVVVYKGTGSSVNLTGLSGETTYYVKVYKYNGSGYGANYLTWDEASDGTTNTYEDQANFTTKNSEPTSKSTGLTFSNVTANSMQLTWTKPSSGGGDYSLVVVGTADPTTTPTDTNTYTASTVYGSGSAIGSGSSVGYVVYKEDGNTVTVTGLVPNTQYYARVYEFNGSSAKENYFVSQYASGSRYTLAPEPAIQANEISFSDMSLGTNTQVTVNWVRGDGDEVVLIGKAGSAISTSETPSDQSATFTNADAAYGSGTSIGQGYVLYTGTGNTVNVTSLQYGQTYYFKAFEYNTGSGDNTTTDNTTVNYNTSDATNNPNSRIADSYESNDVQTDAKFIDSDGTSYSGLISSASDVDWFSFRPDFENNYNNIRVNLTGLPENYTIELYRSDGRLLRRSKISGTEDEVLVLNNLPNGDYYVKIYSADGEYSLTPYRVYVLHRQTDYKADTQ